MICSLWALVILSVTNGITILTSYIANNTFPQPLPEDEEADYISRMIRGDDSARHILTEHNLRLVAHIVKKFDGSGEDTDDLISIGTIGLIKAIDTYRPDKGTRLATYAARCIENEISIAIPNGLHWQKLNQLPVPAAGPVWSPLRPSARVRLVFPCRLPPPD